MIRHSSKQALAGTRPNRHSKWVQGEASARDRLARPVCIPHTEPGFQIGADDAIFAIGSCFARNVEEQLARYHRPPLSGEIEIPGAQIHTARAAGIVNKYNSRSIRQELAWAAGEPFPREAFLDRKGVFYDPHIRSKISDCPLDELAARREHIRAYFQRAFTADVFIATLGLAEFWLDEKTGLALNETPPPFCLKNEPDRFTFCIAEVDDVLEDLAAIRHLVRAHGKPGCRIVVTTSPVPLGRTFTGRDVIIANMHSKSTLRVAALEFARRHDDVDYYPSYEAAMLSDPRIVWMSDRLHVSDFMVGRIIAEFLRRYGVEDVPADDMDDAGEAGDGGDGEADLVTALRAECDRLAKKLIRMKHPRGAEA